MTGPPQDPAADSPNDDPAATSPQRKPPSWRLIVIVVAAAVIAVVGFQAMNRGTSAASLEIGDCFELPDSGEFRNVTEQDCAGRHEAQIYATISSALGTAEEQCRERLLPLAEGYDLPADAGLAEIAAEDETFSSLCLLTSDSGSLVGSIMP